MKKKDDIAKENKSFASEKILKKISIRETVREGSRERLNTEHKKRERIYVVKIITYSVKQRRKKASKIISKRKIKRKEGSKNRYSVRKLLKMPQKMFTLKIKKVFKMLKYVVNEANYKF